MINIPDQLSDEILGKVYDEMIQNYNESKKHVLNKNNSEVDHPNRKTYFGALNSIYQAAKNDSLIVFLGAGCTRVQGYPGWDDYINDFIGYWIYNIHQFADKSITVCQDDIDYLKDIRDRDDIGKKRKLDLVYQVLEKYLSGKCSEFRNHYEKYRFQTMIPSENRNVYYNELANLNALFMTTNYDYQFEETAKNGNSIKHVYKDIWTYINSPGRITQSAVVHLHGTPDCIPSDHLINSGNSYTNLYIENSDIIVKLQSIINKQDTVVLFIGSSMDEEEILSIFCSIPEQKFKSYAILKSYSPTSDRVENEFFLKKNITVLRYGYNYEYLPKYLNILVECITNTLKGVSMYSEAQRAFVERSYVDVDKTLSINNSLTYDTLREHQVYTSGMLFHSENFPALWNSILNDTNEMSFSFENKLELIKMIRTYNVETRKSIKIFFDSKLSEIDKLPISVVFECFFYIFTNESIELKDNSYLSYYVLYICVRQGENFKYTNLDTKVRLTFDDRKGDYLYETIKKEDEYHHFSTVSSILKTSLGYNLYYLLNNDIVLFTEETISKLSKLQYFQRIVVRLENSGKQVDSRISSSVFSGIDYSNEFFGEDLNEYVERRGMQKSQTYKDAYSEVQTYPIVQRPYLDINEIKRIGAVESFDILRKADINKSSFEERWIYSDNAQAKQLLLLYDIDRKLYLELFSLILGDLQLIERFFEGLNIAEDQDIEPQWIKIASNACSIMANAGLFTYDTACFYKRFANMSEFTKVLTEYSIEKMYMHTHDNIISEDGVDLNLLINSPIGMYFDALWEIYKTYKPLDVNGLVNKIRDIKLRDYYIGKFFYDLCTQPTSVYQFIGYCHSYVLNEKSYEIFKKEIQTLLRRDDIQDRAVLNNLHVALVWRVDEQDIDATSTEILADLVADFPTIYQKNLDEKERGNIDLLLEKYLKETSMTKNLIVRWMLFFFEMPSEVQIKLVDIFNIEAKDKVTIESYEIDYWIVSHEQYEIESYEIFNKILINLLNNQWFVQDYQLKRSLDGLCAKYSSIDHPRLISDLLNETKNVLGTLYVELHGKYLGDISE